MEATPKKNWKNVRIEDVCEKVTSGGTPSRKNPDFYTGEIPWIKTKELNEGFIYETEEKITEEAINKSSAKIYPINTVLMAMYGDGSTIGSVCITGIPASSNQACCAMIPKTAICYPLFLMYSLKYHSKILVNLALGGAQRNLNQGTIKNFKINLPPINEQKIISSILSTYDDLIENNTHRIAILEKMAQTIYREWFVKFRFPGHEKVKMVDSSLGKVPKGWEVVNLFEIAAVTYGFPFKSKQFTENSTENSDGNNPVIRIRNIKGNETKVYTDQEVPSKYKVINGDLLVGMDGEFHMGKWAGGDAWLNQRVVRFRPKIDISYYFLFHSLVDPIKKFNSSIVGTTVAHLSDRDLKSINLIVPCDQLNEIAKEKLDPIFNLEINLILKNRLLRQTRDLLLPKLISGKLDVSDLDIEFPDIEEDELSKPEEISKPESSPLQKKTSNPAIKKKARVATISEDSKQSVPIEEYEADEIMAFFRQVGRSLGITDRDTLLKKVSVDLGYQRLGPMILEILRGHLRSAIRRKIIGVKGQEVWLETPTMAKYYREELVQTLCSVMKTSKEYEREEVMYAVANHLGFRKLPEPVRKPIRSAINSAIRQGIVESNGSSIWRVK